MPMVSSIYPYLAAPLFAAHVPQMQLVALDVQTPLWLPIHLSFWLALFLTSPLALYEMWQFVAPGLYAHEKKRLRPFVFASLGLFGMGMWFGYRVILPFTFGFLAELLPENVPLMADIAHYFNFVFKTLFWMGMVFQTPLITLSLLRFEICDRSGLLAQRPYVIIGCFVVGMLIAPPDVLSQTLLALPLWGLFELGIWMEPYFPGKDRSSSRVKQNNPSPPRSQDNSTPNP